MYGGDFENVTLKCKNEMANVIIDQFGKDVRLRPLNDDYFTVKVDVAVSNQFLSWIIALGGNVKIVEPQNVKIKIQELLHKSFVEE